MGLVAPLIEITAAVVGDVDNADPMRMSVVDNLLDRITKQISSSDVHSLRLLCYRFWRALEGQRHKATYRRHRCAKVLGDRMMIASQEETLSATARCSS